MDLGIAGRRALVGGASSGLGRASADRLAAEGCRLAIWARHPDALERTAADLRARHGATVATIAADAADPGAAAKVAEAAIESMGGVDILVLNAGGPPAVDPDATDPAGWAAAFQLLAITPIDLASRLLPGMREAGWGRVVAIMSWGVREPIPNLVYSNAGRSALAGWLKTIARAVASDGVTVNGVMPGRYITPRTESLDSAAAKLTGRTLEEVRAQLAADIPIGRYGRPEEFAALVGYLCSELASYQTGTLTAVDGGLVRGV